MRFPDLPALGGKSPGCGLRTVGLVARQERARSFFVIDDRARIRRRCEETEFCLLRFADCPWRERRRSGKLRELGHITAHVRGLRVEELRLADRIVDARIGRL